MIGSIKRNYSHFPFTIFKKKNTDYFISGSSYMSQTIIDCQTRDVFDNSKSFDGFCWSTYYQIDENTLCVCGCFWGGPSEYRFYDLTDPSKGWQQINIDKSLRRYSYVLFNNDVGKQKNYSGPLVEDDKVIFTVREGRVKDGDIDMELSYFKYQDYYHRDHPENIVKIEDYESKIYYKPMSKIVLKREGDTMKLIYFWRSEEQIEMDREEDEEFEIEIRNEENFVNDDKYKRYLKLLKDRFPEPEYKYTIRYSPKECNIYVNLNQKTYIVKFGLNDLLASVEYLTHKDDKLKASNLELENIIELMK